MLVPCLAQHPWRTCLYGVLALVLAGGVAWAQQPGAAAAPPPAAAAAHAAASKQAWRELTVAQRQALAPLAGSWGRISEGQRRKWLALAENFSRLSPAEQAKLHSRMSEWAALSPRQRTEARLNFGETQQLSADEKKAKWEAYQALSPEEKRKLSAGAARKTPATAAAVRPVPPQKLVTNPKDGSSASAAADPASARIHVAPRNPAATAERPAPAPAATHPAAGIAAPSVSPAPAPNSH